MRIIVAMIFILALIGGTMLVATYISAGAEGVRAKLRRKQRRTGMWELEEESDGEQVVVYCLEPGTQNRLLVGAAPFAAQDFDMQLELLRSNARQKLVTLNSERRGLKR